MAKGFVQVNGTTYELWSPQTESLLGQLAQRLQAPEATGVQHLGVRIDNVEVDVVIHLERVWSAAAWLKNDGAAPNIW